MPASIAVTAVPRRKSTSGSRSSAAQSDMGDQERAVRLDLGEAGGVGQVDLAERLGEPGAPPDDVDRVVGRRQRGDLRGQPGDAWCQISRERALTT
ncbi:hypothetical protein [Amycolatopsis sp. NPDC004169]|uniref:hypothetical protein n=1 Tax=Amycolatopsis sp. NPDC004169 TaxID=3154453 RepID=UPI0033A23095